MNGSMDMRWQRRAWLLLMACLCFCYPARATSSLSFTGREFDVNVIISNQNDQIVQVQLYDSHGLLVVLASEDLVGVRYDLRRRRLEFSAPSKGERPRLEFTARGRKVWLTYGTRREKLKTEWFVG